ncbi:hypothetical protein U9M48_041457 [Paspalum notatum var. saurae]|uniref:EamA domain-containing protein n=1 Tax=Paspalum notatum var. saurae TaxID=547442 RepID=A0AAQ3XE73_PASNO
MLLYTYANNNNNRKAYVIAIIVQLIYTGMFVVSKAAFDHGINTYVFIFYRQAAASILLLPIALVAERKNLRSLLSPWLLLKLFLLALVGITFSLNLYNVSLNFTSATVASAATNAMPAVTFCFALLLKLESVRPRSSSGAAKLAGVSLCLAGVFVIAFYLGPALNPVNHHRAFSTSYCISSSKQQQQQDDGTFLIVLANMAWSLWIVLQGRLLKEYPNKMLVTVAQCVFSAVQCFVAAVAAERDFSKWQLRLDITLLAVLYTGLVVTGVTYYLQAWCVEMKGPVFFAVWTPLSFVFTIFSSSFFLSEIVHLGSIVGGILLVAGLYSVLWGKSKEASMQIAPCDNNNVNTAATHDADDDEENSNRLRSDPPEMAAKKAYLIAVVIQLIYTGMFVFSKAAFDHGINTYVYIFYRMAAASLFLLPIAIALQRKNVRSMSLVLLLRLFFYALVGNTFSLNLYNVSMKLTTATVASASSNSLPVITFCLALLLRMEAVKLRTTPGVAKVAGVALCLAGVLVLAFYAGPALSPVNHHRAFADVAASGTTPSRVTWIKGTLLMVLANATWALWIVMQSALLKEYPNKMLVTVTQCVFSTVQCFVVAVVAERDFSKWKLRLDVSLLGILYTGFVVTGVSYYLQAWCMEMKGPVFLAMSNPLCFVFTIFCSSFFLGEIVHLGSILGGALLVAGLYSVLWAKSREAIKSQESEEEPGNKEHKEEAAAAPAPFAVEQFQRELSEYCSATSQEGKIEIQSLAVQHRSVAAGPVDPILETAKEDQPIMRKAEQLIATVVLRPPDDSDSKYVLSIKLATTYPSPIRSDPIEIMAAKKAYLIAVVIQLIYTGMFVVSKAAFDDGINTYVYIFY